MLVVSREFGNEIASLPFGSAQGALAMTELVIWDGRTTAGAAALEGTYFYVITYTTLDDEVKTEKGSVTLLR
ncbi:MAG: hypothetical protein COA97_12375 [Flavobacteriales bacterium]|nr:MAG: hypothetical protein COA97_12375 [Flavobacteriales bacterium]